MRVGIVIGLVVIAACSHGSGGGRSGLGPPGTRVTLRGRVSDSPLQHLAHGLPGKETEYFDHGDDKQAVVHWVAPVTCPGEIEITGVVVEHTGRGKHRAEEGRPARKVTERAVDVETARCVE